jgi:hypothetical protein
MNTTTPEEANEYISKFIADEDLPEQSPVSEESIPWQEKPPSSWAEFLGILKSYSEYKGWEIIVGTVEDMSLAIFAHEDQITDGAEVRQERFAF